MTAREIIDRVNDIKKYWKTNDPFQIAEHLGISVIFEDKPAYDYTAHIVKFEGYPTMIAINNKYTAHGKRILCAHEIGHALLHEGINHFKTTSNNLTSNVEYEANLFAIALLLDDETTCNLSLPLEDMNNYLLKTIIDYNLEKPSN